VNEDDDRTQRHLDRRELFALAAAVALTSAASGIEGAGAPARHLLQRNAYPVDAETPLELLTDYLTPNDLFFVRHHFIPTLPDRKTWRLVVNGEVDRPLQLSLEGLRKMPQSTATCVLQCAGNGRRFHRPTVPGVQWGHGAVGNARWTGVRVKDLLERAGLRDSARHVHTFGTDTPPGKVPPFSRSLEMEKALADAIVALEMNGEPLAPLHGAPARLVVPGWAGDHWMKWLGRISAEPSPQSGFYMDVGYRYPRAPGEPGVTFKPEEMDPVKDLFVKSTITVAPKSARVGKEQTIRGFALSGAPDISRVEVTMDGGETWSEAALAAEHDPYAWRQWSYRWTPAAAGRVTLQVRATDSRGSIQPKTAVWNQSGYFWNGWHEAEVEVMG